MLTRNIEEFFSMTWPLSSHVLMYQQNGCAAGAIYFPSQIVVKRGVKKYTTKCLDKHLYILYIGTFCLMTLSGKPHMSDIRYDSSFYRDYMKRTSTICPDCGHALTMKMQAPVNGGDPRSGSAAGNVLEILWCKNCNRRPEV